MAARNDFIIFKMQHGGHITNVAARTGRRLSTGVSWRRRGVVQACQRRTVCNESNRVTPCRLQRVALRGRDVIAHSSSQPSTPSSEEGPEIDPDVGLPVVGTIKPAERGSLQLPEEYVLKANGNLERVGDTNGGEPEKQVGSENRQAIRSDAWTEEESGQPVLEAVLAGAKSFVMLLLALGPLVVLDRGLKSLFAAQGWLFPPALAGMFGIITVLVALSRTSDAAADKAIEIFSPALNWIQRWLPLFYVPPLVTLPLALSGVAGPQVIKMLGLVGVGMVGSLLFTAFMAIWIRERVNTTLLPMPPPLKMPPFSELQYKGWGSVFLLSMLASYWLPSRIAVDLAPVVMLSGTVGGYLVGCGAPAALQSILHPIIICALGGNLAVFLFGLVTSIGYMQALQLYTTAAGSMAGIGAGNFLMSFLGIVILSFGFKIFGQRALMRRHAPEIFGSTLASCCFSLFGTAVLARLVGLEAALARAVVPRSVTVALALPIAKSLSAPTSITAAAVVLTGLLGANFAQLLLNKFGFKDPIARGLATAGSAHGLGTAALAAKEPDALPFCALAYALMGVASTVICSLPPVRAALIFITG